MQCFLTTHKYRKLILIFGLRQNTLKHPSPYFQGFALCLLDRSEEASPLLLEILKLTDMADSKVIPFTALHAEKMGHLARALKLVMGTLDSKPGAIEVSLCYIVRYFVL